MSKYKKFKNKTDQKFFGELLKYLPCFLKGFLVFLVGILLLSFAYYKANTYFSFIFYFIYIFIALAGFLSGNSTYHKLGGRGIVSGSLGALPPAISIFIVILCFSFESFSALALISPVLCVLFGTVGGIVGSNMKKRY